MTADKKTVYEKNILGLFTEQTAKTLYIYGDGLVSETTHKA